MKRLALSLCILLSSTSFAVQSFMPENNLDKEDRFYATSMNEATFNSVIATVERVYKPIIRNLGGNLVIKARWLDSTVNAYADREDGNWNVSMFGGLARRPEITPEGFMGVICHELNHHIGGFPLYQGDAWAANEGQSDMGGFHVCMRKVLASVSEEVKYLSPVAVAKCKRFNQGQNLRVCYHVMGAAKSLADLLGALGGERAPRFETPDTRVVAQTDDSHPAAQCRLDTMAAGAICPTLWDDRVIPNAKNHTQYNCTSGEGARPRCWFKP